MIKRILSALILIPLIVWLVIFAQYEYFGILTLFAGILAYLEWLNMDSKGLNSKKIVYFILNAIFISALIFYTQQAIWILFFAFIVHLILCFDSIERENMFEHHYYFGGILYTALYVFLYFIIKLENGRYILILLFISIWSGDSFAYFCGKKFGKHKLAKLISPKKTIEGAICGVVLGAASGVFFAYIIKFRLTEGFMIALIVNITGIVGDLAESVIKRAFGKKDSSNLIPGHGGILDRLDSSAFAGFFVYVMVLWKIL